MKLFCCNKNDKKDKNNKEILRFILYWDLQIFEHTFGSFLSNVVIQFHSSFPWLRPEDTLQLPIDYLVIWTYGDSGKWDFFNGKICLVNCNDSRFIIPGIKKWRIKKVAIEYSPTEDEKPKNSKRKWVQVLMPNAVFYSAVSYTTVLCFKIQRYFEHKGNF